jgi:hypothetical protein
MRWLSISRISTLWFVRLDCNERAIVSFPTLGNPLNKTRQPVDFGIWVNVVGEYAPTATLLRMPSWYYLNVPLSRIDFEVPSRAIFSANIQYS